MFDVSALVTPKNPKDLKILKSFEVAQSIFCLQGQGLSQADLQLLLICSKIPPVLGHQPDLTTCTRGPDLEIFTIVINERGLVHILQCSHQLQIRDKSIGAHSEELLVEKSQSAQDRCLCRVGKRFH